jgi:hypothetical protein
MTLGQFFEICSTQQEMVLMYFALLPLTAALAKWFGKGEGHLVPWNYLYTFLIYAVCIPGIFSITLSIYRFLFERGSIMDANIYTQILPILSMFLTLGLVKSNISLDLVPGFGKISSLLSMIAIILIAMWVLEKTNVYVFTFMPFYQFLFLLIVIFIVIRYLFKKAL